MSSFLWLRDKILLINIIQYFHWQDSNWYSNISKSISILVPNTLCHSLWVPILLIFVVVILFPFSSKNGFKFASISIYRRVIYCYNAECSQLPKSRWSLYCSRWNIFYLDYFALNTPMHSQFICSIVHTFCQRYSNEFTLIQLP